MSFLLNSSPPSQAGLESVQRKSSQSLSDGIATLPAEIRANILHYILVYSTRNQLKQYRFSKATYPVATPLLFSTMHISASKRSFVRLEQVAKSETLAWCVRMLVFHRGTWAGHSVTRSMLRPKDFEDFAAAVTKRQRIIASQMRPEDQMAQLALDRASSGSRTTVEQMYANFQDELREEITFEREIDITRFISKLVPLLSNLCAVSVPTNSRHVDEDESDYYERAIGLQQQTWTKNYFTPPEVIQAVAQPLSGLSFACRAIDKTNTMTNRKSGLKELRLDGVNFADFTEIFLNQHFYQPNALEDALRGCFGRLQVFSLSPADIIDNEWQSRYDELNRNWTTFINSFRETLRHLRLDMSYCNFHGTGSSPTVLSMVHLIVNGFLKQPSEKGFSKLKTLTLVKVQMDEDELIRFLERAWASLEVLQLHGWQIPVYRDEDLKVKHPQGSILSAFYRIGQLHRSMREQHGIVSRLRRVSIRGEFSNRIDFEGWRARPDNRVETIYSRGTLSDTNYNTNAVDEEHDDSSSGLVSSAASPWQKERSTVSIRRRFELYMLGRLSDDHFPVPSRSLQALANARWTQHSGTSTAWDNLWSSTKTARPDEEADLAHLRTRTMTESSEFPELMETDDTWEWAEFALNF